jgi:hypothetical protein
MFVIEIILEDGIVSCPIGNSSELYVDRERELKFS